MYFVYVMTNKPRGTLYVGVTNDLRRRAWEHRHATGAGFTARYQLCRLVYWEEYRRPLDAIDREKQLKAGPRRRKEALIQRDNPRWSDLAADWF